MSGQVKRLYDPNLYRFDSPQPSYWEATAPRAGFDAKPLDTDGSCDVAIIGGGYTGLSAALHLARDYDLDVRVLEAGHIGWGASGRNAGFCTIGGTWLQRGDLVRRHGVERARDYYRSQIEAVELVRQIASEENIDVQVSGSAEIEVAHSPRAFRGLRDDADVLSKTLGMDVEIVEADAVRERFFDYSEQYGALQTRPAFGLHPLRYCHGLAGAAHRQGARLYPRSEVTAWQNTADGKHQLITQGGRLRATTVIFATNGFMPENLRAEFYARTLPVISAMVVTRPLTAAELQAHRWRTADVVINSRRVFSYYRLLPDRRLLFGGRGHTRGSAAGERQTYADLESSLAKTWPHWSDVDIEYCWQGLICMTGSLAPCIGQLAADSSVYFGFGYHGNGVNTATWAGKQLADWIGTGRMPDRLPVLVRGLCRKIPLAPLRRQALSAGIAIARRLDAFS